MASAVTGGIDWAEKTTDATGGADGSNPAPATSGSSAASDALHGLSITQICTPSRV